MVELELLVLHTLDFDLLCDGPLPFLERYVFLLSSEADLLSGKAQALLRSAQQLCLHMQIGSQFLEFKPSEIAATAILTAL